MGYVLLYPKRSGVGGENPAEGQYWSEHLVPKMVRCYLTSTAVNVRT